MRLLYHGISECGKVRRNNEDSILMRSRDAYGLFLVADGVGGKADGEVASRLLSDGYDAWWMKNESQLERETLQSVIGSLTDCLQKLNRELVDRYGPMATGSTIALLLILQARCIFLSAGDSRIYQASGMSLRQITADDVFENSTRGTQRPDPGSVGKLTSAVGIRRDIEFSVRTGSVKPGLRFFLCTDGVYKYISPSSLRLKLGFGAGDPAGTISEISREVDQNGAKDNYSMILVKAV